MPTQVSYPGVYIEEFTPGAPIQGVSTSTAAFLGLCKYGPPLEPTLITSWDAFLARFADPDLSVKPEDNDYLWYAVRGFFQNEGKICFVTAVSNAEPDSATLLDGNGQETVTIKARTPGQSSPPISVAATVSNKVKSTEANLFEPEASISIAAEGNRSFEVTDEVEAAKFLGGDEIHIEDGADSEDAVVARIQGKLVFLSSALQSTHAAGTKVNLRLLKPFARTFRVQQPENGLSVGSIITLKQIGVVPFTTVVQSIATERISKILTTYRLTVKDGINGFTLYSGDPIRIQSEEFDLAVTQGSTKTYPELSMSPGHPRYFANIIHSDPVGAIYAEASGSPSSSAIPENRPVTSGTLSGGENHDPTKVTGSDYQDALTKLGKIDDINIVAAPGLTDDDVQIAVIDHCAITKDRFAILDSVRGTPLSGSSGSIETQRNGRENDKGVAALYYPWLIVTSELTGKPLLIPPSGHVAGIYARTDNNRGVFKAPAGTEAIVNGALGVEQPLTDAEQGLINMKGINVIRVFRHGGRPVVWGARTTSENTNWQYVNIRRLFLFLEESIQQGIRGAVFEPNNLALWQKLKRTISAFLTQQWRDGALFGERIRRFTCALMKY